MPTSVKKSLRLIGAVLFCEAAGGIGTLFTAPSISGWYTGIVRPSFNPPNWVFGPVWTLLFALMGVSLWMVIESPASLSKKRALWIFGAQLLLNVLWTFIFFGTHSLFGAVAEIVILWIFILWTIVQFSKISRLAAGLLLPYLAWVSFATALSFAIWKLN